MLQFHRFPDLLRALQFASAVLLKTDRFAMVYESQEASTRRDPFPYELTPPIVLVERLSDPDAERRLIGWAQDYGGEFAGT